jgi:hypothetical protein
MRGRAGKKGQDFWVKMVGEKEMEVMLNNKYTLGPEDKYFEAMPFVIDLINEKNSLEKKKYHDVFDISYFPTLEFELGSCKM